MSRPNPKSPNALRNTNRRCFENEIGMSGLYLGTGRWYYAFKNLRRDICSPLRGLPWFQSFRRVPHSVAYFANEWASANQEVTRSQLNSTSLFSDRASEGVYPTQDPIDTSRRSAHTARYHAAVATAAYKEPRVEYLSILNPPITDILNDPRVTSAALLRMIDEQQ